MINSNPGTTPFPFGEAFPTMKKNRSNIKGENTTIKRIAKIDRLADGSTTVDVTTVTPTEVSGTDIEVVMGAVPVVVVDVS